MHSFSPSFTCDLGIYGVPVIILGPLKVQTIQEVERILSKDTLEIICDREPAIYTRLILEQKASGR